MCLRAIFKCIQHVEWFGSEMSVSAPSVLSWTQIVTTIYSQSPKYLQFYRRSGPLNGPGHYQGQMLVLFKTHTEWPNTTGVAVIMLCLILDMLVNVNIALAP